MLKIGAVDLSAESRNRLSARIDHWVRWDVSQEALLPSVAVVSSSPDEIRFRSDIDICFVGPELLAFDAAQVANLRKVLTKSVLVCVLDHRTEAASVVEQLARFGIDDVLSENISAADAVRKLILLASRKSKKHTGRLLVVESAKGGVGVTSLVAGLGEAFLERGENIVLVDWDTETQDLSRFLQAKPFVNETLRTILDTRQPLTDDSLKNCVSRVWQDEDRFSVMSPPAHGADLGLAQGPMLRAFSHVHEALVSTYTTVIVDPAALPIPCRRALYQIADGVLSLVNGDPSTVYSACARTSFIKAVKGPNAKLWIVPYGSAMNQSSKVVLEQVVSACKLDNESIVHSSVPWSASAHSWPASGGTIFSRCRKTEKALTRISHQIAGDAAVKDTTTEKVAGFNKIWTSLVGMFSPARSGASGGVKSKNLTGNRWSTSLEIVENASLELVSHDGQRMLPERSIEEFVSRATVGPH